ncbi:MAG: hypothetical protein ACRECT_00070 [Thermoplasmata archaeon]
MTLAVVPVLAGAASASPAPSMATNSPSWAYGGTGYSNGTSTIGESTLTWNASFGWTVIFTETNTSATTVQIEEQRTVGVDLTASLSSPRVDATYSYHADEVDLAFANLTNASTVYVNGAPVAALGIDNDSTSISGAILESISVTSHGSTESADLNVTGHAHTSAQFTPSLGLVPLNLTGVTMWNSSATIDPEGAWNITYAWANNGFNGEDGSGSSSANGSVSASGPVSLTGYDVTTHYGAPVFSGHQSRQAVILIVQGPLGNYDAFVLVPRAFDLFGTQSHAYDSYALGGASISSETLYLSPGGYGPMVTAGSTTFGASAPAISGLDGAPSAPAAAAADPSTTVMGAPMSVGQAQAENQCLTSGCASSGPSGTGLGLWILAGAVVVVAVGTVVALEWRRRGRSGSVVPYGAAVAQPGTGVPGAGGPAAPGEPPRTA